MDGILHSLNAWRESSDFPQWLPYLRLLATLMIGFTVGLVAAVVEVDEILAAARAALRDIELCDKQGMELLGVNRGNYSDKLRGVRPFTVEALAKFPIEFWQAFSVRIAMRVGPPAHIAVAGRLARDARRQARMSLPTVHRQESAS
jgi:hypothetical protein